MYMYILKIHILKVYGQTGINNLLNHVVFFDFGTWSIGDHKPPISTYKKLYSQCNQAHE